MFVPAPRECLATSARGSRQEGNAGSCYVEGMRRLLLPSALLALAACSQPAAGSDAATVDDAGSDAASPRDSGPVVVEPFADVGASSEGIALGRAPDGTSVLYVGVRDGRIVRVTPDGTVSTFARIDSPVGLTVRPDGALLVCASAPGGGASGIFLVSTAGAVTTLVASGPGGTPFMLTNYVAVAPDGSIVFSDSAANQLFRADADGTNVAHVADISYANGLSFSPDGATLYVASWDTATLMALSFDRTTGMYGAPSAVITGIANIDGVVTTSTGALALVTSSSGVLLVDPAMPATHGELAARTSVTLPANGVFGDASFGTHELFLSTLARNSIYVVHTSVMAP